MAFLLYPIHYETENKVLIKGKQVNLSNLNRALSIVSLFSAISLFEWLWSTLNIFAKAAQKFPQCAVFEQIGKEMETEKEVKRTQTIYDIELNIIYCSRVSFHIQLEV